MKTATITKEAIRKVLLERKLFASLDDTLTNDTEFVLDSLSLVWFIAGLEHECGIRLDEEEDWSVFTSINAIYSYVTGKSVSQDGMRGTV
ncbi:hypothetical protein K0T92_21535 [Paenibacillus oenotherae]|uniref:Acyl carrier protein n=1 Tax=Paenibacillus oenotherae TaxID=1435645 RepID=A0ABS7DBJ0_9BACL|nr:hypothetical protein [Paenibacillus oenotherae]MBW7477305.1 hypothetical protein [Paenibacillus oenotherae]